MLHLRKAGTYSCHPECFMHGANQAYGRLPVFFLPHPSSFSSFSSLEQPAIQVTPGKSPSMPSHPQTMLLGTLYMLSRLQVDCMFLKGCHGE